MLGTGGRSKVGFIGELLPGGNSNDDQAAVGGSISTSKLDLSATDVVIMLFNET
jgi:hypothetical protein